MLVTLLTRPCLLVLLVALMLGSKPAAAGEHKIDAFAELGPNLTDNAFFSETDEQGDGLFIPAYGIQFAGPLSDSFSYYARIFLNNERHDLFTDLNGELAAALIDVKYSNGPWSVKGRYYPQFSYSENFSQFQIGLYDYYLTVTRSYEHGKLWMAPKFLVIRTQSTSASSERTRAGVGLDVSYTLVENKILLNFGWVTNIALYDEPVDGIDRRDWRHQFYTGFSWTINDRFSTGIDIAFARNDSTIENASWSRFDVTPLANLTMKLGRIQQ